MKRTPASRVGRTFRTLLAVLLAMSVGRPLASAADEDDADAIDRNRVQVSRDDIAEWVFANRTPDVFRRKAEQSIRLRIESIEQAIPLTEAQKSRLLLAGQGDIRRFFDGYDGACARIPPGRITQEEYRGIYLEMQEYRRRVVAGVHGSDSLFRRTLRSVVGEDGCKRVEEQEEERRRRRHEANVRYAVVSLEARLPLTASQRKSLIALTLKTSVPPDRDAQGEGAEDFLQHYIVMIALARLPDESLTEIFDAKERRTFDRIVQPYRGLRVENGVLTRAGF